MTRRTAAPEEPTLDRDAISRVLAAVAAGDLAVDAATEALAGLPFEDLGDLRLDHHRALRTGTPEVVYGEGKTPQQCADAVVSMQRAGTRPVLVTRASREHAAAVQDVAPEASWDEVSRVVVVSRAPARADARVAVVAAGTSDLAVARECLVTLDAFGWKADLTTDVGVAGVHRLLAVRHELAAADVVVVTAGMEGALPSAVAGIVPAPVIAVPTSVGYGAAFDGLAALLGMLTACAPGIAVVNIDNGFGAAVLAHRVLQARDDRPRATTPGTPT